MCLGAEIAMTLLGIYWLATGKAALSKTRQVQGMHARIMGAILLFTVPIAVALAIAMGVLVGAGVLPDSAMRFTFIADAFGILSVAAVIFVYQYLVKDQAVDTNPPK